VPNSIVNTFQKQILEWGVNKHTQNKEINIHTHTHTHSIALIGVTWVYGTNIDVSKQFDYPLKWCSIS